MLNRIMLLGRLGRDPEQYVSPQGKKTVRLSIATEEPATTQASKTEWHRVVVFDQVRAGYVMSMLKKGNLAYVYGYVQTSKWKDKKTGQDRYSTEVVAQSVLSMEDAKRRARDESVKREDVRAKAANDDTDSEIPF